MSSETTHEESERKPAAIDTITLPRWIVYFQAAMLGVIATTFFIFGMMVGNLTSGASSDAEQVLNVRVSGKVNFTREGQQVPDNDAVVLLLPVSGRPLERSPAKPVNPATFEPLNNPGIERVSELGGAVVRVNESGVFNVSVDGPEEYHVVVISANQPSQDSRISKAEKAVLATYFRPVEEVIGDREYYWSKVSAMDENVNVPRIVFE